VTYRAEAWRLAPLISGMENEDECCAICFEPVAEEDRTVLPCQCNVLYCLSCWEQALAASFNGAGRARCPTCRLPVCVDFDPAARGGRGRLVFSSGEDLTRNQVVNRLAEQAAPLMTRLMRSYGSDHPTLRPLARDTSLLGERPTHTLMALLEALGGDPSGCNSASGVEPEKAAVISALEVAAGGAAQLAAYCTAADDRSSTSGLPCVCGGRLERLGGRERRRLFFQSLFQPPLSPEQMEQLLDAQQATGVSWACIVCDLCDKRIPAPESLYTCGNGERTILHPTTYDVCEACFVRYAVCGQNDCLPTARRPDPGEDEEDV